MALQFLPIVFLIALISISGVATVSHGAHLDSLSHTILAHLRKDPSSCLRPLLLRRDHTTAPPSPALSPTPPPASKPDPPGQTKKSKNDSENETESEDTSQPTSSTGEPTTVSATFTIIVSPTPVSSTSLIATTSSALPASTTRSPAPSSTSAATSTPSKSSVSAGLIAGVVVAILLVLAALTWVISMRRHLRQREWQFKYHERIFDGPEGLLSKKQQVQQQRKEEVHEMIHLTSIKRTGPTTTVAEKELPAARGGNAEVPQRAFHGREVKRKPVGDRRN